VIYGGLRIITATHEPFIKQVGEDWSRVRSPGRAARRRRQGHQQNIVPIYEPTGEVLKMGSTLFMHPATVDALTREIDRRRPITYDPTIPRPRGLLWR
jgi:hypothetical protein